MQIPLSVLVLLSWLQVAHAEAVRGSLFSAAPLTSKIAASGAFVGRAEGGMFAALPQRAPRGASPPDAVHRGRAVEILRALISEAESLRDGYDAVQHGARSKPRKKPTRMTLGEIYAWIKATPNQPHAIGRYQFIPATLRRVAKKIGATPSRRFSPHLQDALADVLLREAGWTRFQAGTLKRTEFMNNLAKIWAGLPNSSGRSHYDGYAGNKASVSWQRFDAVMVQIAPKS